MTTVYRNSSNLSDARTDEVIRILHTAESKILEPYELHTTIASQKSSSTLEIQRICSVMVNREIILSLEKFGFPDITFHKKKSKHSQYADLRHWLAPAALMEGRSS